METPAASPEADRSYALKAQDPWSSHGRILHLLGPASGRSLLDVGCAQGSLAALLRDAGFTVTCLEKEPSGVEQARRLGLRVLAADVSVDVPLGAERFDVLLLGDVIEHVPVPEDTLHRLMRHLAPGGRIVVSVPNVAHLWMRLNLLMGRFEYQDRGILDRTHLRFFTRRSFQRMLSGAGLEVVRLVGTPVPLHLVVPGRFHGRWLDALQWMQARLAAAWKSLFAYQFVACCRREDPS